MKKLITLFSLVFLIAACGQHERVEKIQNAQNEYRFLVYYYNKGIPQLIPDTLKYIGYGPNFFILREGNLLQYNN